MSAEKRFYWIMWILTSQDSPLGYVEDHVWKMEYQKQGAVYWHNVMLFWVKLDTIPEGAIKAEVPRLPEIEDEHLQDVGASTVFRSRFHKKRWSSTRTACAMSTYADSARTGWSFRTIPRLPPCGEFLTLFSALANTGLSSTWPSTSSTSPHAKSSSPRMLPSHRGTHTCH